MSVQDFHEDRAISMRAELDGVLGRGQDTYTPTRAVIERAEGTRLYTVDGHTLIDFAAGVLVANLGHAHPGFERLLTQYRGAQPRTAYNLITPVLVEASRRLVQSLAMPRAEKLLWAASGSEAIQKAMWCARHRHPDRPIMLATRAGFHGKKGLAGDVSGEKSPNPDVRFVGFPMSNDAKPADVQRELDAIEAEHGGRIALLITEPYLGARGSYHPPKWYHPLLQAWCRERDIALIFDEVQACHGRTGNLYAFQTYGVEPDLVVLGKGLGNGVPVAACVGRAELIDALDYGEGSDTFSGNPEACAAVCAVLDVFEQENVLAHAREAAALMGQQLCQLMGRFSFIKAVRGEGLVHGIEMDSPGRAVACVREAYLGDGTLGVHFLGPLAKQVLRVSPPLLIREDELRTAFGILETAWSRVENH
jgi:4-aminobutyrate aminotransferase-like enzyme